MLGNRGKPLSDDEQAQANQAELALALLASPLAVAANTGGVTTDAGASASRLVGIGSATAAHADIADARGERRLLAESLPNPSAMTQLSEVPANVAVPQAAATTIAAANADAAKVARMELPASASPATAEARQKAEPAVTDATLPATVQVPMHAAATRQAAETDMLVAVPVGGKQWETAIGNSVVFMAGHQQNRAELVLTPPQLGRIEIALSINGDQASVLFVSPNPAVREALENALPRLREVLADAGITLGQAQIDSGSPQSSANGGDDGARRAATTDFAASQAVKAAATTVDNPWTRTARGLVDVFA
jgi:flagellar hook-length control protein FliK